VYHSILDDYFWMSRFGDPGFKYHTAMVRVWGLLAYRLADADILPFEESPYPADVASYLDDLEKKVRAAAPRGKDAAALGALPDLTDLRAAVAQWAKAAADLDAKVAAALGGAERPARETLAGANAALMKTERDLLRQAGLPKRPWFKHLLYAPLPTYAAETLPGLREAVHDGDAPRAREQAQALAAAIRARAATAGQAAGALER
jgi:N-acetylated-alpha-linked acidic dipeptidase